MAEEKPVERASCWIEKGLVRMAKEIAAREGKSLSEVLDRDLRAPLTRRHDRLFAPAEAGGEAG